MIRLLFCLLVDDALVNFFYVYSFFGIDVQGVNEKIDVETCVFSVVLSVNGCCESLLLVLTKFPVSKPDFVENVNKIGWVQFIEDK